MRRLWVPVTVILLLLAAAPALAQTATPPPPTPDAERLTALATQVAQASEAAKETFDRAINILGIFEGVGLVVSVMSILGTILAVAAGVIGFRGLSEARAEVEQSRQNIEQELADARQQFETDIRQGREELENVRRRLEQSVREQRDSVIQSNVAMSFTALGERQYRSKDFSGAIDTYLRALELDPNNLITHYRLGYVYTQSGQLDKAQPHLKRALELEPNFPPALAALGYVYRRVGEKMSPGMEREKMINQAEKLLLDALDISPKLVDEDSESWWGSLGGLYRRRNQVDEAINAYERAAEVTPQSSYAFSNLALLYMQKQNRDAMLKTYRRVEQLAYHEVQAEVDNYWAYADLLTSRLALGKVKEAEDTLVSVLEVAPPESPFFFDSLLDTLRRLAVALGDDQSGHVRRTIEIIESYRDQKAQQDGQPVPD
ncbi:MAG: tetratricopeptide repeat protein [Chloroflexi bacterium]|nr:tetratricopeptide repeat protein [Chloroflexota bacterium]